VSRVNCRQPGDLGAEIAAIGELRPIVNRSNGRIKVDPRPDGAEPAPDERLLADSLAGNDAAFRTLVERYSREVFQFVARFTRNEAAADDVVQETFLQVYQSAGSFDPGRSFRPWLFAIAANKARDHLRSSARKREVALSAGMPSGEGDEATLLNFLSNEELPPSELLEADEQREIVREIVSRMPDNLREVLVLGYYHHFAYKEIAEVLSVPLGTVKSRLHAAVSYFADAYKQKLKEGSSDSDRKP
jgi:RNA polymerase sigma-70 factor, ECF subfamily